jgi:hypothetical protein
MARPAGEASSCWGVGLRGLAPAQRVSPDPVPRETPPGVGSDSVLHAVARSMSRAGQTENRRGGLLQLRVVSRQLFEFDLSYINPIQSIRPSNPAKIAILTIMYSPIILPSRYI